MKARRGAIGCHALVVLVMVALYGQVGARHEYRVVWSRDGWQLGRFNHRVFSRLDDACKFLAKIRSDGRDDLRPLRDSRIHSRPVGQWVEVPTDG